MCIYQIEGVNSVAIGLRSYHHIECEAIVFLKLYCIICVNF